MKVTRCGFDSSGEIDGADLLVAYGPTLLVDIGFDPNYQPSATTIPDLQLKGLHALVDTGATESCIDSSVALQLSLPIVDRVTISGAGGLKEVNVHLAQIRIPLLQTNLYGLFSGVDLFAGGQPHAALIGRTFLRHFVMRYDGHTGSVTIGEPGFDTTPSASGAGQL